MTSIGAIFARLSLDSGGYQKGLQDATRQTQQFQQGVGQARGSVSLLDIAMGTLGGITAARVIGGMADVAIRTIHTAATFEQLEVASRRTGVSLQEIKQFAQTTPFQFLDVAQYVPRLKAFGFEAKEIIPILQNVGDVAAAMGASQETIGRITLALGQMRTSARVSAQDMNQLTQAGVSAWRYLAEASGKSVAEIRAFSEKGMLDSAVAVQVILKGMQAEFGGAMTEQMATLKGQWSNVSDEIAFTLDAIGKKAMGVTKSVTASLLEMMREFRQALTANETIQALETTAEKLEILKRSGVDLTRHLPDLRSEVDSEGRTFAQWQENVEKTYAALQSLGMLSRQFHHEMRDGKLVMIGNQEAWKSWQQRGKEAMASLTEGFTLVGGGGVGQVGPYRSDLVQASSEATKKALEKQNKALRESSDAWLEYIRALGHLRQMQADNPFEKMVDPITNAADVLKALTNAAAESSVRMGDFYLNLGGGRTATQDTIALLRQMKVEMVDLGGAARSGRYGGRPAVGAIADMWGPYLGRMKSAFDETDNRWKRTVRQMSTVLTDFSRNIVDILWPRSSGSSGPSAAERAQQDLFERLQAGAKLLAERGYSQPIEALAKLIENIRNAGSVAQGNAIAIRAFGSAGIEMAAIIRNGTANLAVLVEELRKVGPYGKSAFETTQEAVKDATGRVSALKQALAEIPRALTRIAIEVILTDKEFKKFFRDLLRDILNLIREIPWLGGIFGRPASTVPKPPPGSQPGSTTPDCSCSGAGAGAGAHLPTIPSIASSCIPVCGIGGAPTSPTQSCAPGYFLTTSGSCAPEGRFGASPPINIPDVWSTWRPCPMGFVSAGPNGECMPDIRPPGDRFDDPHGFGFFPLQAGATGGVGDVTINIYGADLSNPAGIDRAAESLVQRLRSRGLWRDR